MSSAEAGAGTPLVASHAEDGVLASTAPHAECAALVPFHVAATPRPSATPSTEEQAALPRALRVAGAALLIASASTFMWQRWGAGNDVVRYLMLLGHTALLGACGLVLGTRLKESRGARTFLALALATTPVHFAVLGGFIRSQVSLGDPTVPPPALWDAPSLGAALGLTGVGLLLLYPLCRLALATLVRAHASWLAHAYLALNALLLVPLRAAPAVGLVFAAATTLLVALQRSPRMASSAMQTPEGRLVRALLVAPPLLVAGRCLLFYAPDLWFAATALTSSGVALFVLAPRLLADPRSVQGLQTFASIVCALGAVTLGGAAVAQLPDARWASVPLITLPTAATLVVLSRFALAGGRGQRECAAALCALALPWQLWSHPSAPTALLAIAVGLGVVAAGIAYRERSVLIGGLFPLALGVAQQLYLAVRVEALWHWGSLSVLGALLIFAASLLERRRATIAAWLDRSRQRWAEWS